MDVATISHRILQVTRTQPILILIHITCTMVVCRMKLQYVNFFECFRPRSFLFLLHARRSHWKKEKLTKALTHLMKDDSVGKAHLTAYDVMVINAVVKSWSSHWNLQFFANLNSQRLEKSVVPALTKRILAGNRPRFFNTKCTAVLGSGISTETAYDFGCLPHHFAISLEAVDQNGHEKEEDTGTSHLPHKRGKSDFHVCLNKNKSMKDRN